MAISKEQFKNIFKKVVYENRINFDSSLKISSVSFDKRIGIAGVSIEENPVLKVNIDYVNKFFNNEKSVEWLISHEIFHILFRDHLKIPKNEKERFVNNMAADSVINSYLYWLLGSEYCVSADKFYEKEEDIFQILRPFNNSKKLKDPVLQKLWKGLYDGEISFFDVKNYLLSLNLDENVIKKFIFIGSHSAKGSVKSLLKNSKKASKKVKIKKILAAVKKKIKEQANKTSNNSNNIKNNEDIEKRQSLEGDDAESEKYDMDAVEEKEVKKWHKTIYDILKKFSKEKHSSKKNIKKDFEYFMPVLSERDKRSFVKNTWSPFLHFSSWNTEKNNSGMATALYLDVSGSMCYEIKYLLRALKKFKNVFKKNLWCFSTEIHKADINGKNIEFKSTGGTSIEPVFNHIINKKYSKSVIVTDGFIEDNLVELAKKVSKKCSVGFIISPFGDCEPAIKYGFYYKQLKKQEVL